MFEPDTITQPTLPTEAALARLRCRMSISVDVQDVYLAYEDTPQLGLYGLLVTAKGDIDRVIAYSPLSKTVRPGTSAWQDEVRRQMHVPARVAERPESASRVPEVVWLGCVGAGERAVPNWV